MAREKNKQNKKLIHCVFEQNITQSRSSCVLQLVEHGKTHTKQVNKRFGFYIIFTSIFIFLFSSIINFNFKSTKRKLLVQHMLNYIGRIEWNWKASECKDKSKFNGNLSLGKWQISITTDIRILSARREIVFEASSKIHLL